MAHMLANLALNGLKPAHFERLWLGFVPFFFESLKMLLLPLLDQLIVLLRIVLRQGCSELRSEHRADLG